MKHMKHVAAALICIAPLGLAACSQAPSDGLSGAAIGGATEVAPAVVPTTESMPATEPAAPAAPPEASGADAGAPMVPEGVVAPADPKSAARGDAPGGDAYSDAGDDTGDASGGSADALNPGDSVAYVGAHNRWRVNYGTAPVVWDATLAAFAQDWANQQAAADTFDHRENNQYGENMFKGSAGHYGPDAVVDGWGDEVQDWDLSCTGDLEQCCKTDWWKCGHFTQVVWSTTTKIGCGKATTASGNDIVVCNYSPAGNMTGVAPFPPRTPVPVATATRTSVPVATATRTPVPAAATATRTPATQATAAPTQTPSGGGQPVQYIGLNVPFDMAIPDNGPPATGVLNVIHDGTIKEVYRVDVNITHPYIGDLSVKLVHPDGTEVMLHDQTGGSTQNLVRTYGREGIPIADLAKLVGKKMKGQWKIVVQDHAAEDSGTLNSAALYRAYTTP